MQTLLCHKLRVNSDTYAILLFLLSIISFCLISLPTAEEAIFVYYDLTEIFQRRSFRVTKWTTNNSEVLQSTPATEQSTKAQ